MKLKLSHKIIAINIALILVLASVFLAFNYISNKSLLSNAMNGVDKKVSDVFAEELAQFYKDNGGWGVYIENPSMWESTVNGTFFRVFFSLMPKPLTPPPQVSGDENNKSPSPPPEASKECAPSFGSYFQRLSLLDKDKTTLIEAEMLKDDVFYKEIKVDGNRVGWLQVGKINVDILPLAEHFFNEQLKNSTWAISISALVAIVLSYVLSTHITAPIKSLTQASKHISKRNFNHKVDVRTKDELQSLGESFNEISRELKRYEHQQKQWLMDISHELRTPLTILIGEISAICDNITQFDQTAIESIQEEVLHIKRLVDDLHELSAMEKSGFDLKKQKLDFIEILVFQINRYQAILKDKGVELVVNISESPAIILGDGDRLSQVVLNLLENCFRYTQSPGVVKVELVAEEKNICLFVEDSGPGVSEEVLAKIFDRLYRADDSRSRGTGGVGLGLSICKKIIESHQGSVSAFHSKLGGLAIKVELPFASS